MKSSTLSSPYIFFNQDLPTRDRLFALVSKAASLSRELGFLEAGVSMMSYQMLSDSSAGVRQEWADDDGDEAKSRFQGVIAMEEVMSSRSSGIQGHGNRDTAIVMGCCLSLIVVFGLLWEVGSWGKKIVRTFLYTCQDFKR
jgi:hypothetical protein